MWWGESDLGDAAAATSNSSKASGWLILPVWFWNKNRENREAKWGRFIDKIFLPVFSIRASLIGLLVKNPPTMQETPV